MFLLLVIPILISGFYVCNHNLYYYYKIHRYEGQYLYLKSALLGFGCLVIASLVTLLLNRFMPASMFCVNIDVVSRLETLLSSAVSMKENEAKQLAWISIIAVSTQIVAYLWVKLSDLHIRIKESDVEKSKIMLMSTILSDSPLDLLLLNSYVYENPIMLTLSDQKVYVGVVSSLGEPNESEGLDQEIAIIPIMSGYRDDDNLKVIFNTDYKIVGKDISLAIRQSLISTATKFEFDVYQEFQKSQPKEDKSKKLSIPANSKIFFWKS